MDFLRGILLLHGAARVQDSGGSDVHAGETRS